MVDSKVTVVIPAYNRQSMVQRAVLSAWLQTSPPCEVIVVDDGSSDRTGAFAAAVGARVITQENGGLPAARNAGLAAATSSWVAFLDSDDEWLPHHLEVLEPFMMTGTGLVASNARAVPSGRLVGHPSRGVLELSVQRLLWPESPLSPSAAAVRRDLALSIGGFPAVSLGEDRLFWVAMLQQARGVVLPEVTCLYHEHGSQMSGDAEPMRRSRDAILADLFEEGLVSRDVIERLRLLSIWDRHREGDAYALGVWRAAVHAAQQTRGQRHLVSLLSALIYRGRLRRRRGL